MNAEFASFAWTNDHASPNSPGQRFTEHTARNLNNSGKQFDSGPATLALTTAAIERT